MQKLFSCFFPRRPAPPAPRQPLPSALRAGAVDWTQLPIELLSLVACYASFHALLRLALVNRRLYQLVVQPGAAVPRHSSLWASYPAAVFAVEIVARRNAVDDRFVCIGDDRFDCTHRGIGHVTSLLSLLRHVSELQLVFREQGNSAGFHSLINTVDPVFTSLDRFTQLRALDVRGVQLVAATAFALALASLPSLSILELHAYESVDSGALTAALHRLCSTQLDHLTLSRQQLHHLAAHQPDAPMPHLQSLNVSRSSSGSDETRAAVHAVGKSFMGHFPSLLRLHVNCGLQWILFDYPRGGPLADWAILLTASSPPVFAPRLTHLAICIHAQDRAPAAAFLPSLPAMYPSLTHVHVGVQAMRYASVVTQCAEWDVAVQAVRAAVGSAWCESVDDVVAWRADVALKRIAHESAQE